MSATANRVLPTRPITPSRTPTPFRGPRANTTGNSARALPRTRTTPSTTTTSTVNSISSVRAASERAPTIRVATRVTPTPISCSAFPNAYYQYPSAPSNIRSKNSFFFAQDEWHVDRRLVLNLGVRYEYSTPKLDTAGPQLLRCSRTPVHRLPQCPDRAWCSPAIRERRPAPTSPIRMTGRHASASRWIQRAAARPASAAASASSTTSSKAKTTCSSTVSRPSSPRRACTLAGPEPPEIQVVPPGRVTGFNYFASPFANVSAGTAGQSQSIPLETG